MNTIERAKMLETYNPIFDVPTTGALVDDSLVFMANTQIDTEARRFDAACARVTGHSNCHNTLELTEG